MSSPATPARSSSARATAPNWTARPVSCAAGAEVTAVACDVTDETSAQLLVDTALERYDRFDIVINNAGVIQVGPVQTADMAHFDTALNTMAVAPVRLALSALPVMQSQGHGQIVTIASIGGKLSVPAPAALQHRLVRRRRVLRGAPRRAWPRTCDGRRRRARADAHRLPCTGRAAASRFNEHRV